MRPSWHDRPWLPRTGALLLAALVTLVVAWLAPGAHRLVEEAVGDLGWRAAARAEPERRVVIVDIDERSVQSHGAWPWPRATMAQLVLRLQEAGVAVQALDIVFPEPKPGDIELAAALRRGPVVLGQILSLDPAASPDVGVATGAVGTNCPPGIPVSSGLVGNAASLVGGAGDAPTSAGPALPGGAPALASGHMTPRIGHDGVVRRVPALICHQGKPYATLALAALARAATPASAGGPPVMPAWELHSATSSGQRWPGALSPAQWLSSPALPGVLVPLDAEGDLRVPFGRQREALLSVSAAEVMAGRADRRVLQGALVLVGATAFGIGDVVATPLSAVASGVEIHAQLAAGLLDGRVVHLPAAAPWLQAGLGLLVAAVLLLVSMRRERGVLPITGLALSAALAVLGASAAPQAGLWLPWSAVALFALLGAAALAGTEFAVTRAQRERLSAHLGAYLPAPMAARLAAIDPSGHLEAERREVSILVADIRNFSAYAVNRPAEQTAAVLHAFSCVAVQVVERHGGVVESMAGDSVIAMWNAYGAAAPAALHAPRALAAACDLMKATEELLAAAPGDGHEASPVQPLALGIGLECGDAIVGSFGPARRRTHAALGEPVTVAVRLQAMTSDLSVPILVGPRMAAALPVADTVSQGEYLLEGLSRHSELFAPAAWPELVPPWPSGSAAIGVGEEPDSSGRPLAAAQSFLSSARATGRP